MKLYQFVTKNPHVSYNADLKEQFKLISSQYFRQLVKKFKDVRESEVYFNPGGIAVSGDIHCKVIFNNGKGVHLFFNLDFLGSMIVRSISGLKDYSGGRNNTIPFVVLENEENLIYLMTTISEQKC